MTTDFEDTLRSALHQAVDSVEPPTQALVGAARQRGGRLLRLRRMMRTVPVVAVAIAVAAVVTLGSHPSPTAPPIAIAASERPATDLASKLVASLPPNLQSQVIVGSLHNKNYTGGRSGFLMIGGRHERVILEIDVVKSDSALNDLMHPTPTKIKAAPGSSYKIRNAPRIASASHGAYTVQIMEVWAHVPGQGGTLDSPPLNVHQDQLPLDQADLQRIVQESGWTVKAH